MISRLLNRRLPGIWARLMAAVLTIVSVVWVVLGVAIFFFNQVSRDYTELSEEHIPRLALASELAENSAALARLTTAIIGQQAARDEDNIQAELADLIVAITAQIKRSELGELSRDSNLLQEDFGGLLQQVLVALNKRQALTDRIAETIASLRWLNVDIQDEVDPLLNDFAFNIAVATDSMVKSADQFYRTQQGERIKAERASRDSIQRVGGEAATLVTLMLQSSVATDAAQLLQFRNLSEDAVSRLNVMRADLPKGAEFLTLKQSVEALGRVAQEKGSVFNLRTEWIDTQAELLELLSAVQIKLSGLQTALAAIGAKQRATVLALTVTSARRSELAVWWLIGLTVLAGLAGAVTLFGYIRRGIVLPLGDMSKAMLAIADGDTAGFLPQEGEDEIGQMSKAVGVFQNSIEARDAAYAQLSLEVTERRRAVEDLKQTQAELVQAGKMAALGQLSSGISHELSQPLAAMKHRVHLLNTGFNEGAESKVRRQIERIDWLVTRMEATITHLKRFARRSEYRSEPLGMGAIIDESALLLKGRIDAPGLEFTVQPDVRKAVVKGDQILIEQVVVNLLANALDAIAAGAPTGTITLSGESTDQNFSLIVADTGVGLGDLEPEAVFDPFFTTKEVGEGLGLGLSISYNIAKDMGGDLRLEPNSPVGTRAILTLPRGTAHV